MRLVTRVVVVDPIRPDPGIIDEAAAALRAGKLVAFPTETVYGLGANALDESAVARIFEAKERPRTDPLIVHIAHIAQLGSFVATIPPGARLLALSFWAGPLTLILPKRPAIPDLVTAGLPNVALRVPVHRVARALVELAGVPVAAPSANRFSGPSPTTAEHVLTDLDGRVDLILDGGPTDIGLESTIVDFTVDPPVVRRHGAMPIERIREVLPEVQAVSHHGTAASAQVAPGQLLRHYAARAPMTLYTGPVDRVIDRLGKDVRSLVSSGKRVGLLAFEEDLSALAPTLAAQAASGKVLTRPYGARSDMDRSAKALYGALRSLDQEGVDIILATAPSAEGLGTAIRDRLERASEGKIIHV
ncbi:MAG: L-threonylcarbamoyladenylate synthase [Vicinamibacterales bacterium]